MLSPGRFYKDVPKDPLANLKFRESILTAALESPLNRRALVEACRQDVLFWISVFVWQFNPLKKGLDAVGPFIPWDFQEEALLSRPETNGKKGVLWCYEHNRSAVVEKSREMGATWLFLIVQDWLALFHPYTQTLNISRSAEAVDSKSPNSLFWKLRFIHRNLPDWLKGKVVQQEMYFGFHGTDATITGEASTGRAGVGGRAGAIFVDEFSKIREAREVRQNTANTADVRFFCSTHEGVGTEFFELTQTPEFVKLQFHWTQHPEKRKGLYRYNAAKGQVEVLDKTYRYPPDFQFVYSEAPLGGPFPGLRSPWYDQKCVEIGSPRGIATELDIDPGGSVSQFFDPLQIRSLVGATVAPYWEGDIHYDRDSGQPLGLVPMRGGPLKLWVQPQHGSGIGLEIPVGDYTAGSDVATGNAGKESTNSCHTVFDAGSGTKVLEFCANDMLPEKFAVACTAICRLFKNKYGEPARWAWEHHGPGIVFGKTVIALGYPNYYCRQGQGTKGNRVANIPGWFPNPTLKRELLEDYRKALYGRTFVNFSEIALNECLPYRYPPGGREGVEHPSEATDADPTGAKVNHGDRVIADALAWKMASELSVYKPRKDPEPELVHPGTLAGRRRMWQDKLAAAEAG